MRHKRWRNLALVGLSRKTFSRGWRRRLNRQLSRSGIPQTITPSNAVATVDCLSQLTTACHTRGGSAGEWWISCERSNNDEWKRFGCYLSFRQNNASQKVAFLVSVHRSGYILLDLQNISVSSNWLEQRFFAKSSRLKVPYQRSVHWKHLIRSNSIEDASVEYLEAVTNHVYEEFIRTLRQTERSSKRDHQLAKIFTIKSLQLMDADIFNITLVKPLHDLDLPAGAVIVVVNQLKTVIAATGVVVKREQEMSLEVRFDSLATEFSDSNAHFLVEPFGELEDFLHTYRVLQSTDPLGLPMKEYFTEPQCGSNESNLFANVKLIDFSPVLKDDSPQQLFPLHDFTMWPSQKEFTLDAYQRQALFESLVKEFTVIRGTPGSGKSYLLINLLKLLIVNWDIWNNSSSPILIISETNVCMDSVIARLMKSTCDIIRVGGQNCTLSDLKRFHLQTYVCPSGTIVPFRRVHSHGERLEAKLDLLEKLYKFVLPEDEFEPVMSAKHLCQLKEYDECAESFKCSGMAFWLSVFMSASKSKRSIWHNSYLPPLPDDAVTENIDSMSQSEVDKVDDIWKLSLEDRWRLYAFWRWRLHEYLAEHIRDLQVDSKIQASLDDPIDKIWFRGVKIFCATTCSAIRFRDFFEIVEPKIVIFDESTERSEPHTVASLVTSAEHVVMFSDYVRHPAVQTKSLSLLLAKSVSYHDRFVNCGGKTQDLLMQHRMRSLMANILVPHIHPEIEHDLRTFQYSNIRSVMRNIFFINHHKFEDQQKTSNRSHSNEYEAQFIFALCRYLIETGTDSCEITVLSPYKLHVLRIKSLMEKCNLTRSVEVVTLDNFHGKENEIVLVSLVRSNRRLDLGFLSHTHRIAVALTRAKKALYCIGNFDFLNAGSSIWRKVLDNIHEEHLIGRFLKLRCPQHPRSMTNIGSVEDFNLVPNGSCGASCRRKLACGHWCPRKCHMDDREHTQITCTERCSKIVCPAGHTCPLACFQKCPDKCFLMVEKIPAKCSHATLVPCYKANQPVTCIEPCSKILPCGHQCQGVCGENCPKCQVATNKVFLSCLHTVTVPCYRINEPISCMLMCKKVLPCGHVCYDLCGENSSSKKCQQMIVEKFIQCGHVFERPCSSPFSHCPMTPCGRQLFCGHVCSQQCGILPCPPCTVLVDGNIPCYQYRQQLQEQLVSVVSVLSQEAARSFEPFLTQMQYPPPVEVRVDFCEPKKPVIKAKNSLSENRQRKNRLAVRRKTKRRVSPLARSRLMKAS